MLPRRPGWTDNILNFFLSGLQELEQRAKKCIEFRWEYVESMPSLVAVACFLPGRAKDLAAPPRIKQVSLRTFTGFVTDPIVADVNGHPKTFPTEEVTET